ILDNFIVGPGAGATVPAISLTSSNNNLIAHNNINGFTGTGTGANAIVIANSASTANELGTNNIYSVTTPISDSGTGTLYVGAQGGSFFQLGSLTNRISTVYLNGFDFNGPDLFFGCTAANTAPAISAPTIGGIFDCGPQSVAQ